ncbi:MAG: dihydroorotate dehydrogenase-like protein [Candidatus Latescibacterota bacterium]
MDLTTTYLGLPLKNPLVVSAGPLCRDLGNLRRMEDAGAAAVVLHSLFEEEIRHEQLELDHYLSHKTDAFAEALDYFPEQEKYVLAPQVYLEHIRRAKETIGIPVIASLNGTTLGGWVEYGQQMEQAGADALELNIYHVETEPQVTGRDVEDLHLSILAEVRKHVRLPVAVKLSPFFSSLAHMATQLDQAGADALVLFNRFYQPDIDLARLEVCPHVLLSTPQALRLPLRWIGILHGQVKADLAGTGGIHGAQDVVKMMMVGASVAMMCSALLANGIPHLGRVLADLAAWLEAHEYSSVAQMRGSMSRTGYTNPAAFERANYVRALNTFAV